MCEPSSAWQIFIGNLVPNFAEIAKPMTNLTRHNARFSWGPEEQGAFDVLKEKLTQVPVLAYADPALPYKLYTAGADPGFLKGGGGLRPTCNMVTRSALWPCVPLVATLTQPPG